MWKRIVDWQRAVDDETLLVLKQPEMAGQVRGRLRGCIARKLATLTPIERQQFHDFMEKYRGIGFYIAAAKLTLLLCMVGVLLHLMAPDKLGWGKALLLSNVLGLAMACGVLGVWFSYRRLARRKIRLMIVLMLLLPLLAGLLIGLLLFLLDPASSLRECVARGARIGAYASGTAGLVYLVPMSIVAMWRNRQYEALTLQLQQNAERDRLARALSESQLRLLRAQIEPHFLFNTLGAVQQLAEQGGPGAARAAALTADLIAFLRASLAEMRSEQVPLQSEFDMVAAYLRVMQARMGSRLRYALELPAECAHATIPSMIVLTLAENAIKHGIEPSLRGGEIAVSAQQVDGMLRLRVRDTGMGLPEQGTAQAQEGGLGLENVRSRLRLSDPCASLDVRDGEDGGVIAEILLPMNIETSLKEPAV
ncbi:sensor histidine kinase [Janthinobacterium sp. PC23-8]|uniref:sensor histidine kinase n=1 Tax=Janthinobacterium sp. PC23-8 TaxID=2012679 RepID=UPI00159635F5|nr:histidine kinase [Janthinobacterium sp. PC23-8]